MLSERIRPNCEAAPWVLQEIIGLEAELDLADSLHRLVLKERDLEREKNRCLLAALQGALRVAEQFVAKFEDDEDYTDGQVETIQAIRAAIGKATGE